MRMAVLGSGVVGKALGSGWARHGHEVVLGTGSPERPDLVEWAAEPGRSVAAFAAAVEGADLVVLATLGSATIGVVEGVGAAAFDGRVVVDATNPLTFESGSPALYVGHTDSLGEQVQRALPGARVVKAYNTVGNTLMVDPALPGGPPTMFVAGDDDAAKAQVGGLLTATGWDWVDLGDITAARELEAMCLAWVRYGVRTGTWEHAFRLLRP